MEPETEAPAEPPPLEPLHRRSAAVPLPCKQGRFYKENCTAQKAA